MDATDIQSLIATALNAFGSSSSANAVFIQLPSSWSVDPESWFTKIEAQFALRSIFTTDDTKFRYVVSALNNVPSVEVQNELLLHFAVMVFH